MAIARCSPPAVQPRMWELKVQVVGFRIHRGQPTATASSLPPALLPTNSLCHAPPSLEDDTVSRRQVTMGCGHHNAALSCLWMH